MSHTPGKLTCSESPIYADCFNVMADEVSLMSIRHYPDWFPETQRDNVRRLAACWNACEGTSTKWLEFDRSEDRIDQFGEPEPFETRYTKELQQGVMFMEQRDQLLEACKLWLADDLDDGTFSDTLRLIIAKT